VVWLEALASEACQPVLLWSTQPKSRVVGDFDNEIRCPPTPLPPFLEVLILKDFKSLCPEVLILGDFKSLFPEVLILVDFK
jgi:hypothetical protein